MWHTFISYVEEDSAIAAGIAAALEQHGYTTWLYERDSVPGLTYLRQTREAIDKSKSFLILISPAAVQSNQVDKEIVHAHEVDVPILPILHEISFADFRRVRPDWQQAIGATVGIQMPSGGVQLMISRVIAGLTGLGVAPTSKRGSCPAREDEMPSSAADAPFAVEDMPQSDLGDRNTVAVIRHAADDDEAESEGAECFAACFVHEHPATGFLIDLVIPENASGPKEQIRVSLSHKLLGASPCQIDIRVPAEKENPVQYLRLAGLIHGYTVVLRVHWLARLRLCPAFNSLLGSSIAPLVNITNSREQVSTQEAAGILMGEKFTSLIAPGTSVPCTVTKRLRTKRDNQKAIAVIPAVMTAEGLIRKFSKLRVSVVPALAGIAWVECTCRVDPDGRYTTFLRNPLHGMRVEDMVGPGDLLGTNKETS